MMTDYCEQVCNGDFGRDICGPASTIERRSMAEKRSLSRPWLEMTAV
jgi:hypothetical protein